MKKRRALLVALLITLTAACTVWVSRSGTSAWCLGKKCGCAPTEEVDPEAPDPCDPDKAEEPE